MWLLLCTSDDHPALWAADRLRARGLSPLVVLTPELLHFSFRWQHRLGNDDPPSVEFTLADGRVIRSAEIRGVLNRIAGLSPHLVSHLAPGDQSYALQEWTALHISWLSALQVPVLNRPVMQGLCGAWRHESEWTWLAARAGLRTAPFRQQRVDRDPAPTCARHIRPPRHGAIGLRRRRPGRRRRAQHRHRRRMRRDGTPLEHAPAGDRSRRGKRCIHRRLTASRPPTGW